MIEVRFHGRGGQGAVVAGKVLAAAVFREGRHVQTFPAFGVERRGAPVTAFLRIDDSPIRLRTQIERPDHVVVLDPGLLDTGTVTQGLADDGWVVVNSPAQPDSLDLGDRFRAATVDASGIAARRGLGSRAQPIVNTAILGAFAAATGLVGIESLTATIAEDVPSRSEANVEAAREAFEAVQVGARHSPIQDLYIRGGR